MARHRRQPEPHVPACLVEFDPADWRGELVRDRYDRWTAARRAYYREHGEPLHALGGPGSEYGDFVDLLNRDGEVRRQWWDVLYRGDRP